MEPSAERAVPVEMDEIGRISATLVEALREAHAMAQAGEYGPEFNELVQHAREMSDLLTEAIGNAAQPLDARVRDFAHTLAASIERMERAVVGDPEH
jgi:hypothetical protein